MEPKTPRLNKKLKDILTFFLDNGLEGTITDGTYTFTISYNPKGRMSQMAPPKQNLNSSMVQVPQTPTPLPTLQPILMPLTAAKDLDSVKISDLDLEGRVTLFGSSG